MRTTCFNSSGSMSAAKRFSRHFTPEAGKSKGCLNESVEIALGLNSNTAESITSSCSTNCAVSCSITAKSLSAIKIAFVESTESAFGRLSAINSFKSGKCKVTSFPIFMPFLGKITVKKPKKISIKTKKISVRSGFTIFQYFFETAKLDFFCGKTKIIPSLVKLFSLSSVKLILVKKIG